MTFVRLSRPDSFITRVHKTKASEDPDQKAAARVNNRILVAQKSLIAGVKAGSTDLAKFADTVEDLNTLSRHHAQYRADGLNEEEKAALTEEFKSRGQDRPEKIDPTLRALFTRIQNQTISDEESAKELNWRSLQAYGEVVAGRPGPVYQDERYQLRAHLHLARAERAKQPPFHFVHPEFDKLIDKTIALFPRLDQDADGIVDRREARSLMTNYQEFGLSPAEAATLYSRQKHLAAGVDQKSSGEALKMEDLEALKVANHSARTSREFMKNVTSISTRFASQQKLEDFEPEPFQLSDGFRPDRVKQGKEGSCWFLANLAVLTPHQLSQAIRPEDDGYRVTLADGRTTFVEPLNEAERRVYSSGDGAWSGLLEKGVSQILALEGKDINGGFPRIGRKMLTGQESRSHSLVEHNGIGPDFRDREVLFSSIERVLSRDGAVFASTAKEDYDEGISEISSAGHAYTVLGLDRSQDTVTLRNPWGQNEQADLDGINDGVFHLSQDQFFANFSRIAMDKMQEATA